MMLAAPLLRAGEWHHRANAGCSDCHAQHNAAGDPAPQLLRRATPLELCLSCHDGSNPEASDVIAPVSSAVPSAAGAFPNMGGIPTDMAHHLNNPVPEVPPGGSTPMVLTCTTCHDPHGNDNYRNLRPNPAFVALQIVTPTGKNIIYKSGVSAWCGTCHGTPGALDHPVDRPIFGGMFSSYATWAAVTLPRVPVHSPADDVIPSQDDQVNCLSCHKAHGSDNAKATIYADGVSMTATCQECHDQ
jgi:predicted CXXCH cytochrome family protein